MIDSAFIFAIGILVRAYTAIELFGVAIIFVATIALGSAILLLAFMTFMCVAGYAYVCLAPMLITYAEKHRTIVNEKLITAMKKYEAALLVCFTQHLGFAKKEGFTTAIAIYGICATVALAIAVYVIV